MKSYINFINEKNYTHKKLNPKFWVGFEFDEKVRLKLIEIVKDFYDTLDIDLEIYDIELTGSIANYNYNDNSDLDVHILIDFENYDGDKEVVANMAQTKSFVWNLKHDINIRGADVELYVQDKDENHISTGLYSLEKSEWIKKPEYYDPDVDDNDVKSKYDKWVFEINNIEKDLNNDDMNDEEKRERYERAEKLKSKLRKFRKDGLNKGELSVENIAFKKLRTDGYIEKLYKASTKYYDSIFSQ